MFRPDWKRFLLLAALMVAGVTLSASPAQAGWWHRNAGYCGWYSYGYYPAYVYAPSYYSPYVTGRGWRSACWSGCYAGCYNPCYTPWYGGCGVVVSDCCDSVVVESEGETEDAPTLVPPAAQGPTPAAPPAAEEPAAAEPASVLPDPAEPKMVPPAPDVNLPALPDMPALPPAPGEAPKAAAGRRLPPGAAQLSVVVPEDSQVYVNGMLTKSLGTHRQYVSYGLKPGYNYTYEVRVAVTRDGETLSDVQVVRVRVGEARDLAFDFAARPDAVIAARLP
jgi:uncharacterized protein (TIGR03000 family)